MMNIDGKKKKRIILFGLTALAIIIVVPVILALTLKEKNIEDSVAEEDQNNMTISMSKVPDNIIDSLVMLYDTLIGDSKQIIIVFNDKASFISSHLKAFELSDSGWVAVDSLDFPANIGSGGFAQYGKKREGDRKSPTGLYTIRQYFSKFPNYEAKLEKINVTKNTIWVDDLKDSLYNSLYEQGKIRKNGEKLLRQDALYDYVMVIDYNTERIPGLGSAIFLHCWRGPGKPTLGCVAVEKKNILKLMSWIDANKHPIIIMGSLEKGAIFNIGIGETKTVKENKEEIKTDNSIKEETETDEGKKTETKTEENNLE